MPGIDTECSRKEGRWGGAPRFLSEGSWERDGGIAEGGDGQEKRGCRMSERKGRTSMSRLEVENSSVRERGQCQGKNFPRESASDNSLGVPTRDHASNLVGSHSRKFFPSIAGNKAADF